MLQWCSIRARNLLPFLFFFSSRRRHTRLQGDWSSDVCSSDLGSGRKPTLLRIAKQNRAGRVRQQSHDHVDKCRESKGKSVAARGLREQVLERDQEDRKSVV